MHNTPHSYRPIPGNLREFVNYGHPAPGREEPRVGSARPGSISGSQKFIRFIRFRTPEPLKMSYSIVILTLFAGKWGPIWAQTVDFAFCRPPRGPRSQKTQIWMIFFTHVESKIIKNLFLLFFLLRMGHLVPDFSRV